MKKFNAVNKRNDKEFIVTMMEDKAITVDKESGKEKEVSLSTIKRWFELGEEIVEVKKEEKKVKKEKKAKLHWYAYRLRGFSLGCQPNGFVKHDPEKGGNFGAIAYDRKLSAQEISDFELQPMTAAKKQKSSADGRKKLTEEQVYEVRAKFADGQSKASLAREYGMSYSGIHWVVNGNTWAYLPEAK